MTILKRVAGTAICISMVAATALAADAPFPDAPEGAGAFGRIMGDWNCTIDYRGESGEMDQQNDCRWKWYYRFDGHMVQDDFWMYDADGKVIWTGATLRTWDMADEQWNNTFLGSHGKGIQMFHGKPVGDEIHLNVDDVDPNGVAFIGRIYFYDINDQGFKWRMERSDDQGATWREEMRVTVTGRRT